MFNSFRSGSLHTRNCYILCIIPIETITAFVSHHLSDNLMFIMLKCILSPDQCDSQDRFLVERLAALLSEGLFLANHFGING